MLKRIPFLLMGLLVALSAAGEQDNNDYYVAHADKYTSELLVSVEKYHLQSCSEGPRTRQFQSALSDCDFILRYFPNHPRALVYMAELCVAWQSPTCIPDRYFENAVRVNPTVANTFVAIGISLLRAKKAKEAVTNLERAVALNPNSLNAQYNLGLAYVETKQYELANTAAQHAYALGAAVPGLRDILQRAGYWKPLEPRDAPPSKAATPAKPGDAPPLESPSEPPKY